jgi:anion-transporting  ArsA/GET3 family ATPase
LAVISALLTVDNALRSGDHSRMVVDTAPFGHPLRLFQLPEHFSRFIDLYA